MLDLSWVEMRLCQPLAPQLLSLPWRITIDSLCVPKMPISGALPDTSRTAPPSPSEDEFISAGFYHELGGPVGKQWEKGAEEERGKREELKNSEGGAWEKTLCGEWNDRAGFLISPRFLIHSSPYNSHHMLSFPSFPWIQCNGFHLQDKVSGTSHVAWSEQCTECVFNLDGLAHCWRRPLSTGIVSGLLPLQQILSLGFLHVRSQNGEVLLQKTSCTGTTGHCSNTLCVGKLSHGDGWTQGWMDESLEDLSFMKITVSCLWSFTLCCSECFI